jgi:hypothetical protein
MTLAINSRKWGVILSMLFIATLGQPLYASSETDLEVEDEAPSVFVLQDEIGMSRPFQAQFMLSAGGSHHNRSINPSVALHLGYRFSELMYLGLTSQAFYNDSASLNDDDDKRYDDDEVYGQEDAKETTINTDPRHLLEMRFFPFPFGLYFSAGLMHVGYEKAVTEFKSRSRIINENEYNTGLTTTLEYKEWTGAATGIGFHHLFSNGLSLSSGLNVGLNVQKPEITIESDEDIATEDLEEWESQIEANEKRIPVMFHIGVGYAF